MDNKVKKLVYIDFHKSSINQVNNILKKLIKIQIVVIINVTNYYVEIEIVIFQFPIQKIVYFLTKHGDIVVLFYLDKNLLDILWLYL